MVEAANKLNTATIVSSMPCKFPALSNMGIIMITLKDARGAISDRELLLGTMYGSLGTTITELATKLLGG